MSVGTPVEVFGVILGSPQEASTLRVEQSTIYSGSAYFRFTKLYQNTVKDAFSASLLPLIEDFVEGYNGVFVFVTPSNVMADEFLAGTDAQKISFLSLMAEKMFEKLGKETKETLSYDRQSTKAEVKLQVLEFTNDVIRDLLDTANRPSLSESSEKGAHVEEVKECVITSASDAMHEIRGGWRSRTRHNVPAAAIATTPDTGGIVIQFELNRLRKQPDPEAGDSNSQIRPYRSRLRLVYLPGAELLIPGSRTSVASPLPAVMRCIGDLSQRHPADVALDFSANQLTTILRDDISANCRTVGLFCFPRNIDPRVLEVEIDSCQKFGGLRTFPISNTDNAYNLHRVWRSINLQFRQFVSGPKALDLGNGDPSMDILAELRRFQAENAELRDRNEFLFNRMEQLQNTYGYLSTAKTDMSTQLLLLEEEKLKASQALVDMQMENNKLEEKMEAVRFQLMNKILTLENQAVEGESKLDQLRKEVQHYKELASHLEVDKKEIADEYVNLKQNYVVLAKDVEKLAKNNEQLCVEFYNCAQAKAAIMREYFLSIGEVDGGAGKISADLKRVSELIASLSGNKVQPEKLSNAKDERLQLEQIIFTGHQRYKQEVEQLRREWNEQQMKWEDRLGQLRKEVMDARKSLRDKQHELSVVNAQYISCRSERDSLQQQFNRLQHKLKDLNAEYQQRLLSYINDIAAYVDKGSGLPLGDRQRAAAELRRYVKGMLNDLQQSHQHREEQLSKAAQEFRQRAQQMVRQHEGLLIAYRNLRQQVADKHMDGLDLGPDETSMIISDQELASQHARENARLSDELARTKVELEKIQKKLRISDVTGASVEGIAAGGEGSGMQYQSWPTLQRQLREFTLNTQRELEEERAQLVARCAVLEEQLREAQEYIDGHLVKYKDEILRLRRLLGYPDDDAPVTSLPGVAVPARFDSADRRPQQTFGASKKPFFL